MILILSSFVELLILLHVIAVVSCMQFANVSIYYSVCIACCMFYCVGELFVECVFYMYSLSIAVVLLLNVMVCVWIGRLLPKIKS